MAQAELGMNIFSNHSNYICPSMFFDLSNVRETMMCDTISNNIKLPALYSYSDCNVCSDTSYDVHKTHSLSEPNISTRLPPVSVLMNKANYPSVCDFSTNEECEVGESYSYGRSSSLESFKSSKVNYAQPLDSWIDLTATENEKNHWTKHLMASSTSKDIDSGIEHDIEQDDLFGGGSTLKKKKSSIVVKSRETDAFFKLLDDGHISEFINTADVCRRISDKYLLAMVFAYFKRANLAIRNYTRMNFFVALYLANDTEEDDEDYKYEIFPWALGHKWKNKYMGFLKKRDKLWSRMDYRAVVSKKCCDEIIDLQPNHWIWKRDRPEYHAGATRLYPHQKEQQDKELYPRGPNVSPQICQVCTLRMDCIDCASISSNSWFLSSIESESSEENGMYNLDPSYLSIDIGLTDADTSLTMEEDMEEDIWAHEEEK